MLEIFKANQELFEVTIRLSAFGGISEKPLALKGNWKGLPILGEIFAKLEPHMASRELVKLTKPSGQFLEHIQGARDGHFNFAEKVWFVLGLVGT